MILLFYFKMYVSNENPSSNDEDFRKALELLNFVENPTEMKMKIWCAAILKDPWNDYDMNSPMDSLDKMIFFKLLSLCFFYGKYTEII